MIIEKIIISGVSQRRPNEDWSAARRKVCQPGYTVHPAHQMDV